MRLAQLKSFESRSLMVIELTMVKIRGSLNGLQDQARTILDDKWPIIEQKCYKNVMNVIH